MNLKQMSELFTIAPQTKQLIIRELGHYGGNSGVNKLFFLNNAIHHVISSLGENRIINSVNNELDKLNKFREENSFDMLLKFKSCEDIYKKIEKIRPHLFNIQYAYDLIRDKELKHKKELEEKINFKRLSMKVSPYQFEIYFLFNHLMKVTNLQFQTVPTEAFKTPQISSLTRNPFIKTKTEGIKIE